MSDLRTVPDVTSAVGDGQRYNNLRIIEDWHIHPHNSREAGRQTDSPVAAASEGRNRTGWSVVCARAGQVWGRQGGLTWPRESTLLYGLPCEPLHDPVCNLRTLRRSQAKVDFFLQDCKEKHQQQRYWEKRDWEDQRELGCEFIDMIQVLNSLHMLELGVWAKFTYRCTPGGSPHGIWVPGDLSWFSPQNEKK